MPKVNWGIESDTVDDWDRSGQFKPYSGPQPPNGVYQWKVKTAQYVAKTKGKLPQLRVGLELVPRKGREEKKFSGYFAMLFLPIAENTAFRYVPFLDAIGVTGADFAQRTVTDEEGAIRKIGKWKNDGETLILAQLADETDQNGEPRKGIKWIGAVGDDEEADEDDDDSDEEYEDDDDDDSDEEPF